MAGADFLAGSGGLDSLAFCSAQRFRCASAFDSIGPDGHITVRLDTGRQIKFDALAHRLFDHGYAVTSHSAQGLTAERVLINADTGVHPDLLNSRFGYVAVSRASHEATIFTNDTSKMGHQLKAQVTKTSDVEIAQTIPAGHGLGLM